MNGDTVKGTLQKIGGRIEESAGVLVNDPALQNAGKEDQLEGKAREAWGHVKDAAGDLVDRARATKFDAEAKSEEAAEFKRDHEIIVER